MKVTAQSRLRIRAQNILFIVLFLAVIGMLAWLGQRHTFVADWTASGRNTLSQASIAVLETLEGPVTITAFVRELPESDVMRRRITDIIGRYQRHKSDITLKFVNPDIEPQLVRELGVSVEGELVTGYSSRTENLQNLTEQGLTNSLQRLARGTDRWIVFLQGHGERSPHGQANHDLGNFVSQMESRGLKAQTVLLGSSASIPDSTTVLVIASPLVDLLPGEVHLINGYLERGGNLLWMNDPGTLHGLGPVAERLGVEFHPGMIVDPATRAFGIRDPRFALVADYGAHDITRNFNLLTLFPQAAGIDLQAPEGWQSDAFLMSTPQSWSETGELSGEIELDGGVDIPGPLAIGIALARDAPDNATENTRAGASPTEAIARRQRIVILGDGDFLSNTYLGTSGNLDLGMNIINWLSRDDAFIAIPAKTAPGLTLELSRTASAVIGLGFLLILPLGMFGVGLAIWLRRRKR